MYRFPRYNLQNKLEIFTWLVGHAEQKRGRMTGPFNNGRATGISVAQLAHQLISLTGQLTHQLIPLTELVSEETDLVSQLAHLYQ